MPRPLPSYTAQITSPTGDLLSDKATVPLWILAFGGVSIVVGQHCVIIDSALSGNVEIGGSMLLNSYKGEVEGPLVVYS